jgi:SAM-dependent methyltransferase
MTLNQIYFEKLQKLESNKNWFLSKDLFGDIKFFLKKVYDIEYTNKKFDQILDDISDILGEEKSDEISLFLEEGDNNNKFYDATSDPLIYGLFHSSKYATIIDTVYYLQFICNHLYSNSQNISVLDIGCNAGLSSFYLAQSSYIKQTTGIDYSKKSIDYAQEIWKSLNATNDYNFKVVNFAKYKPKNKFDLIINSRGISGYGITHFHKVANILNQNGVYILIDHLHDTDCDALNQIAKETNLWIAYRDVIGGYGVNPLHGEYFTAYPFSVFVKGYGTKVTGDSDAEYTKIWYSYFQNYCNQIVKDRPYLQTLSTMRNNIFACDS